MTDAFVPGTIFAKQQSSDSLYALTDGRRHLLTFDEWKATGYQSPTVKPDHFVKYPWSASIYSVSFFGAERESWVWRKLTFEEWSRLGQPAPSSAGWIEGSFYYKYKDSDVVYVALDGSSHALTFAEWRDADYPQPQVFTSMEDMN
ncbi:hypothetical protein JT358_09995 [Micrococcales bacterium 31B]|nr:hypothetical protein [Micrococcales bacterium 31B]